MSWIAPVSRRSGSPLGKPVVSYSCGTEENHALSINNLYPRIQMRRNIFRLVFCTFDRHHCAKNGWPRSLGHPKSMPTGSNPINSKGQTGRGASPSVSSNSALQPAKFVQKLRLRRLFEDQHGRTLKSVRPYIRTEISGGRESTVRKPPSLLVLTLRVRDLQYGRTKGQKALKRYSEGSNGHRATNNKKGRKGYADPQAVGSASEDLRHNAA